MRVVHLSIFDRRGGACIAAYRQHTALRRSGVDSRMWVRFKVTDDSAVHAYAPPSTTIMRIKRTLRRNMLRRVRRNIGLRGEFFDDRSEYGGHELSGLPEADILNVQFSQEFSGSIGLFQLGAQLRTCRCHNARNVVLYRWMFLCWKMPWILRAMRAMSYNGKEIGT